MISTAKRGAARVVIVAVAAAEAELESAAAAAAAAKARVKAAPIIACKSAAKAMKQTQTYVALISQSSNRAGTA